MTYRQLSPSYYRQRVPTDHWWGKLLCWALGPVGLIGIVSFVILMVNFYLTYRIHPFDSDDVILQNALLYWKPFHHISYFGDAGASYVDRLPLYWLVGRILSPGRHALFADGAILTMGNFVLFYWSAIYLLKKAGLKLTYLTLLPFIWMNTFGYAVTELFVETSMHNIEVGIILAICVMTTKIYYGEFHPLASLRNIIFTILCGFLLGCVIVGDRYTVYYGLLPILAYAAVGFLYIQRSAIRKRIGLLFGVLILGFAFAALVQLVFSKAGIVFMDGVGARTPQFVEYSLFFPSVGGTIFNLSVIFNANFWGNNVISLITIDAILNVALLLVILRAAVLRFRSNATGQPKTDTNMPLQLMAVLFFWSISILTISSIGGGGTFHYLILLPFIGAMLLVGVLSTTHGINLRLLVALLIAATVLNLGTDLHNTIAPSNISSEVFSNFDNANGHDTSLIPALEAHGLTKGYGNYWQGNIISYLSGGKVDILPTLCTDSGDTVVYKWLMTSSQLTRPASKTFFLFDPHYQVPPNCPPSAVSAQYGKPAQVFETNGATVYVYDRNITAPLQ
jgi:hypothetical protein